MKIPFALQGQAKTIWANACKFQSRAFASASENPQRLNQPANTSRYDQLQENVLLNLSDRSKPWQPLLRVAGATLAVLGVVYKLHQDTLLAVNNLGTRLDTTRTELKKEISDVKIELKKEISDVKIELKKEIGDLGTRLDTTRTELKKEISDVKIELKREIGDLGTRLDTTRTELKKEIDGLRADFTNVILGVLNNQNIHSPTSGNAKLKNSPVQIYSLESILGTEDAGVLRSFIEERKDQGNR